MACSKPKCRNKSDDVMVACWLCESVYHAKCVDLSARTVDNLHENKGLRWCCKNCILFDVEFYKFFKSTKSTLDELGNDLKNLNTKFLNYRNLFDKAPCSPKGKKKTLTSSLVSKPNSIEISDISGASLVTTPVLTPSYDFVESVPSVCGTASSTKTREISSGTILVSPQPLQNSCIPTNLNPSVPAYNTSTAPTLKVIPPKRIIFAARFDSNTSTDAVKRYICFKIGNDIDLSVYKFKYSNQRRKSSFKIIVNEENFDSVVNPDFWPKNALIREYVYSENVPSDIVHLPQINAPSSNLTISKN